MSKITLITGGSRSGKSTFGESLLKDRADVLYIATAIVTDEEMKNRIEKHKERRNPKWETFEGYRNLDEALIKHKNKNVMLECVGVMTTNLMFDWTHDFDNITQEEIAKLTQHIKSEFQKFIIKARDEDRNVVIITNEVGWSLIPEYKLGRIFSDILGFVNQYIASLSDEVYLVACGLPLKLK